MYHIRIAGELAFDALWDGSTVVSASISQAANAAAYLDLTLAPSSGVSEGDDVTVDWDGEALFSGTVTEVTRGVDGTISASAVSGIDRLSGALVPPHSTDGSVGETCPGTRAAYVQWLAQAYNERSMGGYRVDVGENQADRLTTEPFSVSESGWASVAQLLDDHVLSLGAHLEWEPREGGGTLSIWADLHEAADQLIDLGVNVTDIHVTRTLDGRRTAVVPRCESDSGELTLSEPSEDAAAIVANAGLMLAGGAIYDPDAVARWGWSEEAYDVGDAASDVDLARAGVPRLRTLLGPSVAVEVRAVDAALYDPSVGHLRMGQAARVRAASLGVDEYLAVQDVALDLMDPGQTSYTLGVAYDTLTGRQSTFLRQMNASIDHSLDLIGGVSGGLEQVAGDLVAVEGKADEALDKANEAVTGLGGVTEQVGDLASEVAGIDADVAAIKKQAQSASDKADEAWDKAEQQAQQVEQAVQASKDAAAKADQVASDLSSTAADLSGKITNVTKTVTDQGTKIEGAVEDAGNALKQATELSQTVDGVRATAESALTTAQGTQETVTSLSATVEGVKADVTQATDTAADALSKATSVEATANGIKADLSTNYLSKTDASKTYATQASLSATSSSLTTKITEAATAAGNAMDKATEVEQTASGIRADLTETAKTADSALSKATSVEATANGLKATITAVQEDVDTAQSTADSAKSAADKAQTTANSASTNASTAISRVTSLSATVDGISTKVEQTATTASDALTKATSAQQSIDGFKTTVSQTYLKKSDASSTYATKTELSQTSDSITASVEEKFDDSLLIKTEEGGIVQTGENAGMPLEGLTVYGNTRQNLWSQVSKIQNGITVTANSNGSITLSGTSTSSSLIDLAKSYALRPGSTYVLYVDRPLSTESNAGGFCIQSQKADGRRTTIAYPNGTTVRPVVFTVPVDTVSCFFGIQVLNGKTVSGTYRVMLNEGSEAQPWCPPGLNSVDELSLVTAGKNLIPFKDIQITKVGVAIDVSSDGSISFSGTATERAQLGFRSNFILPAGTYTLSGAKDGIAVMFIAYEENGVAKYVDPYSTSNGLVSFSIKNAVVARFIADVRIAGAVDCTLRPQLELGPTATAYEPPNITTTPIDLDGHALNSLPDGTRDELRIDGTGAVTLVQRVGVANLTSDSPVSSVTGGGKYYEFTVPATSDGVGGNATTQMCDRLPISNPDGSPYRSAWVYTISSNSRARVGGMDGDEVAFPTADDLKTFLGTSGITILYPLATPKVIPLASIEMPELPEDGATIWLSCANNGVNANGEFSWYGRNAKALDAYATRAQLKIESDSIKSEVSQTYTTKQEASEIEQTANTANSTANSTKNDLDAYKDTVSTTYATKTQLQQTENSITTTVSQVQTIADKAFAKASQVEQTADGIQVTLTEVEATANTAKTNASTALSTANSAKTTATNAQNTANTANSNATTAKNNAATALSTANTANSTATAAQTAATNAAKTATNYLKFDSSGLCVGNHTSTLTYNTLVKSTGVDIRNGSTVLSSFGASLVELGKNSESSRVTMCGGNGTVSYGRSSLDITSLQALGLTGRSVTVQSTNGSINLTGDQQVNIGANQVTMAGVYNRIGSGASWLHGVYAGSKTIHPSNTWPTLFTNSQYTSIVGRAYNGAKDVVLVQNGNSAAANIQVIQAFYNPNTNEVCVSLSAAAGTVQIQYLIVAGA